MDGLELGVSDGRLGDCIQVVAADEDEEVLHEGVDGTWGNGNMNGGQWSGPANPAEPVAPCPNVCRAPRATEPLVHSSVARHDVLDRINDLLDAKDDSTINTPMRVPSALREAASLAVEHLGVASSTTTLTAAAVRSTVETAVMEAALESHYEQHPDSRPSLAEVALALGAQDGSPVADRLDRIERAAAEVTSHRPDADADDVLLWAEAQLAVGS